MGRLTLPQHSVPDFEVENDCLVVAGEPLTELAARLGGTPFYVYERERIVRRVQELRAALPRSVHLHYAIKANPMPAVVNLVGSLVDGLDVASVRELETALGSGVAPSAISFAGPGKKQAELERAAEAGIVVNVESEREIAALETIARKRGQRPRIAVRVNPDFELKASGMKMGGGARQFGIDAERVPAVLAALRGSALEFVGFHIFCGSQNLQSGAVIEAQRKSLELAIELAASAPVPVRSVNLGGGFGIPYFPGDKPLDIAPIGAGLEALAAQAAERLPGAQLVIELGRYIVGEAGLYVCGVIDRKVSRGQVFLVTDGGLHHHLAASGNFGQILRKNYPVLVGNRVLGTERERASVVGPLCTPLDLLGDRIELAHAEAGDLIVVLQSGAYGFTASPLGFLSHPAPREVLV
jgi:diaminopimelate decarboxylase